MNKSEKQAELTALKNSFEAQVITAAQYTAGIVHIMNLPENAPFSATKNLGLEIFEKAKLIKVGKCSIPFDRIDKSRKLRVATMLKDNPEEERNQRKFYEN
jgi:hypothetical protein